MVKINGFVVSVFLFVLAACGIYYYGYLKYQNVLAERKSVYERFVGIDSNIDLFPKIVEKIEAERSKLIELLSIYDDYYIPNTDIEVNYRSKVENIFKQYKIPITNDDIIQMQYNGDDGGPKGQIYLSVKFKANYEQTYQVIFDIEKISKVSDIKISYLGDVTFKCTPNLYPQKVNDYFTGRNVLNMDEFASKEYFKDVSERIKSVMNMGNIPTWRDLFPAPKSPMYPGFTKAKQAAQRKKIVNAGPAKPLPPISLEGVMFESKEPIAIIDGKLLTKGAIHKGAKLVRIKENAVSFEYYGRIYDIKMEN